MYINVTKECPAKELPFHWLFHNPFILYQWVDVSSIDRRLLGKLPFVMWKWPWTEITVFLACLWDLDFFIAIDWMTHFCAGKHNLSCPTIHLNKCRYFPQFSKLLRQIAYWIKIAHKNFVVLVSIYPCLHSTCILKCLPSYLNTFMLMLCIQMYVSICLPPPSCISKRVFQRHM